MRREEEGWSLSCPPAYHCELQMGLLFFLVVLFGRFLLHCDSPPLMFEIEDKVSHNYVYVKLGLPRWAIHSFCLSLGG